MPVARFCCACLSWRCSLAKGDRAAFLAPTSHKKGLTQSQLRGTGLSPDYYCTACPRRVTLPAVRESCLPGTSLPACTGVQFVCRCLRGGLCTVQRSSLTGGWVVYSLLHWDFVRRQQYQAFPKYSGALTAESHHGTEPCFIFKTPF